MYGRRFATEMQPRLTIGLMRLCCLWDLAYWLFANLVVSQLADLILQAYISIRRPLGAYSLTSQGALDFLRRMIEDQADCEALAAHTRDLLRDMLEARKELDALGKLYDLWPAANSNAGETMIERFNLPDEVVVKMLGREVLLSKAKLFALTYEHRAAQGQIQRIRAMIRQVGGRITCNL